MFVGCHRWQQLNVNIIYLILIVVLGYYLIMQWLPCCYNIIVLCIYVHGTPQQIPCYWASSYEVVIYSCYCLFLMLITCSCSSIWCVGGCGVVSLLLLCYCLWSVHLTIFRVAQSY